MPALDVLQELQTYLIAQGVGVAPFNPKPAVGAEPVSIWLYPRDGAALPRNVEKVAGVRKGETIVSLVDTHLMAPPDLEAWILETFVDVVVRSPQAFAGKMIQRQIKDLLSPIGDLYGRKNWMMGGLLVEYSTVWRGDQPLPQRQAIGETDPHLTYDRVASYRFGCRRSVLAGA